jgi:peptidoglycan glycosyltransferase
VNRQITQIFGLVLFLFTLLIGFTSWWSVVRAQDLEQNTANRRTLLEEQRTPRGALFARDGTRLTRNRGSGSGRNRRYTRTYPQGELFSHAVGYSFVQKGRAGLEQSKSDELSGDADEFGSLVDEFLGRGREGQNVRTTLDVDGQRTALNALKGRKGAVVALEPETGKVRVMLSVPTFDPNDIPSTLDELNQDEENAPIVNRATQSTYPPGSTMKVVTAAAALDSGRFTPSSTLDGRSNQEIGGFPLQNFGNQDYGPTTLTEALTNSVNTVWGRVGEQLGARTMYRYMRRFGFNQPAPVDLPPSQVAASGVFGKRGRILDDSDPVDIGRVAIGQERLQVTPLQMAMVAGAVGNEGALMRPTLTERVVDRDGRERERVSPDTLDQVMKPSSARQLTQMMANVVREGSGTAAALSGVPVAGKTGTAETEGGAANQAWFIGFAPSRNPKIAVAATIERTQGTGGEEAAPIAKRVLQSLL